MSPQAVPGEVLVGVYLRRGPRGERDEKGLAETLEWLAGTPAALVLLADDPPSRAGHGIQVLNGPAAGPAAAFNRLLGLLTQRGAPAAVFLESGSLPAPGWLEALLAALEADPAQPHGLAGPSANLAWNRQRAAGAPSPRATRQEIVDFAGRLAREAAGGWERLEPLHDPCDFCLAVIRAAAEATGGADEAYGAGPCWEMDLAARASRAGFPAVWARGAYVHRRPVPSWRIREEDLLHPVSRRLYQQRLCGRQLQGGGPFRDHCRGDACENFAPRDLVQLRGPHPPVEVQTGGGSPSPGGGREGDGRGGQGVRTLTTTEHPLVSCLMPTSAARRAYIPQAVRYFLRQDWPARELVVIDDGAEPVRGLLPDHPSIRYVRLEERTPLGAKRNRGCEAAQGDVLVHWDDDDWMSERRLSLQVEALLAGQADLCGLDRLLYFEPSSGKAWEYVYPARGRSWVAGGTFCYRREAWRRSRFPAIDVGEDTRFLWAGNGPRVLALPDNRFYAGLMHGGNTSTKHTSDARWQPRPAELLHGILGPDLAFYGIAAAIPLETRTSSAPPLVSCIMPTRDRPGFVRRSIEYFLRQDYPDRELLVADDGAEPVEHLLPGDPRVRYLRCDGPLSLGEKRNRAIAASRGAIIAHWDDDDWYRRDYLSAVVEALRAGNDPRALAGLGDYLVLLPGSSRLKLCRTRGVAGATFCYFRGLWEATRFRDVASAEDYFFLADAAPRQLPLKKPELFMVVRHRGNTWRKENGIDVEARLRRLGNYPQPLEQVTGPDDARFYRETLDPRPPLPPAPAIIPEREIQVVVDRTVPLVSCIMPTHNRRLFVPQAIRYFQRQDYPNKELVVVDDGADPVGDLIPADERIRYLRLPRKVTIGEKRNRAVEASRGSIVVHFDDDDWHGAGRLTCQLEPLLHGEAEVCGLDTGWLLNVLDGQFWSCAGNLHARMFYADVHGGSIGYKREVWQHQARFPQINLAEDAAFLRRVAGRTRIRKVLNPGVFVYVRHDDNAWAFICGQLIDPSSWQQVEPPPFIAPDLEFYTGILRTLDTDASRQKRLGDALRLGRRYPEALERYERALAANPLDPWAWYDKGQVLEALGRHSEALAAVLEADRLLHPQDGNRPWVHAQLGKLYRRLGSREQARRQIETALRLDPRNPTARSELRGLRA